MPYINVGRENSGNIDLYYEDHGSGKTVILIHGWPLSGRSWEKQIPELLNCGCRVISYDRRGFGYSSKPSVDYNYDIFAEDLHRLIVKLDLRNAVLVGFSMGGGEVARYIGAYGSDRVKKAVFISPVTPFLLKTPDNPKGVDGSVFEGIKQGLRNDRPAALSQFLSNFYNVDVFKGKLISDQAVAASWNAAIEASPIGTVDCVTAWTTDFRKDLSRINVPSLIVQGNADRILPFEVSGKRTHDLIDGSRLVVVENGPHGIIWTHADKVNKELTEFIGE